MLCKKNKTQQRNNSEIITTNININDNKMVVLETASALLGGPYAQGAPALKMVQKRYIGLHQWLGPIRKELKEHIVSFQIPKWAVNGTQW